MIKLDYNPTTFEAETRLSQILDQPEIHRRDPALKKKKAQVVTRKRPFEML